MRQILVVEDHKEINQMMTKELQKNGYNVYSTYDAIHALNVFQKEKIDCIITDLMLPLMSGEEMIEEVRKTSSVHIIVISAKTRTNDKLNGLKIGANDYLYKPFITDELIYKLNNLFAGKKNSNSISLNNGELRFEEGKNFLFIYDNAIELTAIEYQILHLFFHHVNHVLSRNQFLDVLYHFEEEAYDRVVDVHIKNIRKKIRNHTDNTVIKTVYGLGYKLVGDVDD